MYRFAPALLLMVSLSHPAVAAAPSKEALEKLGATVTAAGGAVTQVQVDAAKFTDDDFRTLGQLASLKKLTLGGKTLDDRTLPLLAGLTELEELSTNQSALTDDGYRHFKQFPKLRSLALFHPSWNLKEFTGAGLVHLKDCPKLERLTFAGSTAGDAAMEAVGQIAQLRDFSTWHTAQTPAGNEHLLKLAGLTSLRLGQRLPKGGTPSAPSLDAATIPLIAKLVKLQKVEIFEARLTAKDLEPLKALPELKQLTIRTTDIPAADVEAVRAMLKTVKVEFKPLTAEERESLSKKLKV